MEGLSVRMVLEVKGLNVVKMWLKGFKDKKCFKCVRDLKDRIERVLSGVSRLYMAENIVSYKKDVTCGF